MARPGASSRRSAAIWCGLLGLAAGAVRADDVETMQEPDADTCGSMCVVNEVSATCKDHIQQSSVNDFLGDLHSCDRARDFVASQCPTCAACPAHEAGCGVLEPPTRDPTTTTIPPGGTCEAVCELGGQQATCKDRILWVSTNVFINKPDACTAAHDMVLGQCSVCGKCQVMQTTCVDDDIRAAQRAEAAAAQRAEAEAEAEADPASTEALFDCGTGDDAQMRKWSAGQKSWCCEHKDRGCDEFTDATAVFRQKFDTVAVPQGLFQHGRLLAPLTVMAPLLVLVGVMVALLAARGRRSRPAPVDEGELLELARSPSVCE